MKLASARQPMASPVSATMMTHSGGGHQIGNGAAHQHGGPPHGQGAEPVDHAFVQVGAQPDGGAHGRRRQVQGEQPGEGEVLVAAAPGIGMPDRRRCR